MHTDRRMSVSDSLATAVLGADYATPRKPRVHKDSRRGPAAANVPRGGGAPIKDPDEVLLEVRRLREQHGMAPSQIRTHMQSLGVDLKIDRVHCICEYTTRSHLVPAANALPYIGRNPSE